MAIVLSEKTFERIKRMLQWWERSGLDPLAADKNQRRNQRDFAVKITGPTDAGGKYEAKIWTPPASTALDNDAPSNDSELGQDGPACVFWNERERGLSSHWLGVGRIVTGVLHGMVDDKIVIRGSVHPPYSLHVVKLEQDGGEDGSDDDENPTEPTYTYTVKTLDGDPQTLGTGMSPVVRPGVGQYEPAEWGIGYFAFDDEHASETDFVLLQAFEKYRVTTECPEPEPEEE
jgi:hypothetical protein